MHDFKFYASATVGTKGQIVIPIEAREDLGLREGEKLIILRAPHHEGLLVLKADKVAEIVSGMNAHAQSLSTAINDENK